MAVIIIVHKIFAKLSIYSKWFGSKVKGKRLLLFRDGEFDKSNMNRVNITEHDILEDLRLTLQSESLETIKEVYVERSGEISFIKRDGNVSSVCPQKR